MKKNEREIARIFKAMDDENRIKILEFLRKGERCVCEIFPHIGTSQSNVSQHLRVLREAGLIDYRKDGKKTFYHVKKKELFDALDIIKQFI
ncbi:MAG: ArsR/SmtB family transcription factor [Candidatus Methanofastidiosia archaeon]